MLYGALANPGYLVLGEVETPTHNISGKLECLDSKARIYKKVIAQGGHDMAKQLVLPKSEITRKPEAIKVLSLGFLDSLRDGTR